MTRFTHLGKKLTSETGMLPDGSGSLTKCALAFGNWRTSPHIVHLGIMSVNQCRISFGKAQAVGNENVSVAAERK